MNHPTDPIAANDLPMLRSIAAVIVTIPSAGMLTLALWALSGSCALPQAYGSAFVLLFLGFLPFSLSVQSGLRTQFANRLRQTRYALVSGGFVLFVAVGPGSVFAGGACSAGPTVVQTAATWMALSVVVWASMRLLDPSRSHS